MNNFYKKKWFWFILLLVSLAMIIPYTFSLINRIGKNPVDIIVAPGAAEVFLNDAKISRGVNYLDAGTYQLTAKHTEFSPLSLELVVLEGENPPFIVLLTPSTEKGWEIANSDPAFLELEQSAGQLAIEEGASFSEANPITDFLPYRSGLFNIDYRVKDDSPLEIVLIITVHELERKLALSQIKEWGFDPGSFDIEYRSWW